jgi:molecular chaperone HscC
VSTLQPNQTEIVVKIYQGESRRVEGNLFLGEFTVKGIPRGPAGQPIDVRFTYDLNGVLEVEATVRATREKVYHVVTKYARGLSKEQVQRAVDAMAKLKTHPREEATTRFLLRRADRVYKELSLEQQHVLSQFLDGFEEALELRDEAAIERHREVLQKFLDRCDGGAWEEESDDDPEPSHG